jgi:hypothetical protein
VAICYAPGQGGLQLQEGAVLRQERERTHGSWRRSGVRNGPQQHGSRGCSARQDRPAGCARRGMATCGASCAGARAAGRQGQRRRHLFVDAQEEGEDARGLGPAAATGAPGGERGNREKGG